MSDGERRRVGIELGALWTKREEDGGAEGSTPPEATHHKFLKGCRSYHLWTGSPSIPG